MKNTNNHILELISAYTTNELSKNQYVELQEWLNANPENKQLFLDYLYLYKKSRRIGLAESIDNAKAWDSIVSQLNTPLEVLPKHNKSKVITIKPWFKYAVAASIVIVVALAVFYNKGNAPIEYVEPIIVNNQIKPGTDKAILTLEDGTDVPLTKGTSFHNQNVISNGEEITYQQSKTNNKKTRTNVLSIPRGGQFFVKLSDGTKVWLNSESQLKYPVAFVEGQTREVELVYGEAYFEVSPSTEHKGAKFKVINKAQEVKVLGTEFNIKAYKDETNVYTTLVKGKVAISTASESQALIPNQQSRVNIKNNHVEISNVDVTTEIAWVKGDFIFQHKSLKDIATILERWYDVDFKFQNKELADVTFNGELSKNQNLEEILTLIKNTKFINNYEIKEKTVILK